MLNQDTINLIENLSKNKNDFDDNVKAFLTFGHLFENNPAVTLANTYVISGKPALNADAMCGVVRRYTDADGVKICAYIRVIELTEDGCIIGTKRRDELGANDATIFSQKKQLSYQRDYLKDRSAGS